MPQPERIVDTARYPIHDPSSPAYRSFIEQASQRLAAAGYLCLDGFLGPEGLRRAQSEASRLEADCYRRSSELTVYFGQPDESRPQGHPLRHVELTAKASAARHQMAPEGTLNRLYTWEPLRRMVADLLGHDRLYLHDDPSNALVVNYYRNGERIGWHFDRARFAITVLLTEAEQGGAFEFHRDIRGEDDPNYDAVAQALDGRLTPRSISVPEGTLMIFKGRHSLHRIRPVQGPTTRQLLIMHFEEEPGVRLPEHYRRLFFGPTAPGD